MSAPPSHKSRSNLPDGILEPQIARINISGQDLGSFAAITSDMTVEQLSWYIDNTVAKELLGVPGLAKVDRNGGVDRQIRVVLDPVKLAAQGLTAAQVNQQLRQVNLNAAGGRAEIAGSEQSVRVLGNAQTAYDLGQVQIIASGGRTVRVGDLGRVEDSNAEQRTASRTRRSPGPDVRFPAGEGRVRRHRLQGGSEDAHGAREALP